MTDAGLIPISRLLTAGRPPDLAVSIDAGESRTWADFTAHVAGLAAVLDARGPGRWLLFTENTYAFAVALMAVWQSGGVAVVAPNGQPGTLSDLAGGTHGLVTERERFTTGVSCVDAIQEARPGARPWRTLDRTARCLELLTSGSTGARKAVPKTLANLDDEVAGLERQWGAALRGQEIFGTVSHQHIYGLLFRVLWPLSAGRTFHAQAYLHPEEIVARIARADAAALVSSPAHLSRLKAFPELTRLSAHCRTIFSSGGPLDRVTAAGLRAALGAAPFEIFGSTETGGVAWRRQDGSDDSLAWTPFADVAVECDPTGALLRVQSPFVSDEHGRFTMADRAEALADGRFVLGERSDRVVKLGDKRLSLPEMESALGQHPFVSQAALLVLDHGPSARLGAAVVLSSPGREALARQGRRALSQDLLRALEPYWDRILLPRVWRYVSRLPEDAQGKITVTALRAVFASPYDPGVVVPEILEKFVADDTHHQILRVPDMLGCLDGHFPGFPVVPGVAQIQWVMDAARALVDGEVVLQRIEALKFKDLLRPGEVFHLELQVSAEGDRLGFRLWNDRAVFSSGRCILAATGAGRS